MFIHGKAHYKEIAGRIADKLSEARKEKKVTITQLAARMGIRRSLIYNIEQKKCSMSVMTLLRFSDALGLKADKFLED